MPNFNWFVQCVENKMDVSQDFTDSPRKSKVQKCLKNILGIFKVLLEWRCSVFIVISLSNIKTLYNKEKESAILFNDRTGDCFRTTDGVCQGCILSPNPL